MPEVGNNFSIRWTEKRKKKYNRLETLLNEEGLSRWSNAKNIWKAIDIAIKALEEKDV